MNLEKNYKELLQTIKNYPLQPVYIITGTEEYLRETAISAILQKRDTSQDVYSSMIKKFGDEIAADELRILLSSYSLFAEYTFIIVEEARKLPSDCWDAVKQFMKEGSNTVTLILDDEKFDIKREERKETKETALHFVRNNAAYYEFPALKDKQITVWLKEYARQLQLKLTDDALQLLKDSSEPMLRNYVNEFEKLRLFIRNERILTVEDIAEIAQKTRSFNVFEFIDSLCDFRPHKVAELLQQILLFNESVSGILILIVRHLIILTKIKLLREYGIQKTKIAEAVGIAPYFFGKYDSQASRVSIAELQKLCEVVLETDTHIKTGYRNEKVALTLLLYQFKNIFYDQQENV